MPSKKRAEDALSIGDQCRRNVGSRYLDITVICATFAVIYVIILICRLQYVEIRNSRLVSELENDRRVLLSLRDHTMRLLDYSDSFLRSVRYHYQRGDQTLPMTRYLKEIEIQHSGTFLGTLLIGKADGQIVFYSDDSFYEDMALSKRPYFSYFRDNPQDHLYLDPTRPGWMTKQLRFRMIRPVLKDGAFDGIVMQSLYPEHFTSMFESYDLGPNAYIALLSTDRYLIARVPALQDSVYGQPRNELLVWNYLQKADSGYFVSRSPLDGVKRHTLYAKLLGYPLVVVVGVSEQDIDDDMAEVRSQLIIQAVVFVISSILSCLLVLVILGRNRRMAEAEKIIRVLAETDSLTGARNRRSFMSAAEQEFSQAQRQGLALSVMMVDADHFKAINDRAGHLGGDVVLRQLVKRAHSVLRQTDLLGRIGGEEFAILLPRTELAGAVSLAERLRETIASTRVDTKTGTVGLTVSIGVCSRDAETASLKDMLQKADEALYRAKDAGRNRVVAAAPANGAGT